MDAFTDLAIVLQIEKKRFLGFIPMLIDLHKQHGAHLLRPIFGDPGRFTLEQFIDGCEPKVEPKPEMLRCYGVVHFVIDFLMYGNGISVVFAF